MADKELFDRMSDNYQSDKEKWFFVSIKELEQWDCSVAHDIILSQDDNSDNIFIIRANCNEYIFGCDDLKSHRVYVHVMTLSEALSSNLKTLGVLDSDTTLLGWLRARNYEGVSFERNLDDK